MSEYRLRSRGPLSSSAGDRTWCVSFVECSAKNCMQNLQLFRALGLAKHGQRRASAPRACRVSARDHDGAIHEPAGTPHAQA